MMEQMQLDLDSEFLVIQDNAMVMGNYDMTSLEQKLFLILVSTIKQDDTSVKQTKFRVKDIASLMDVTADNLYRELPKTCKSLIEKVIEIKQSNGSWEMFNLITYAQYKKGEGTITLEINKKAEPYLFRLKELFTSFKLENALFLSGKYSIRIYQLCKSCLFKKELVIELEDLKKSLKLNQKSYNRFNTLSERVIIPAIKEINEKTDIKISVDNIKSGRNVIALKFNISRNNRKRDIIIRQQKNSKNKSTSKFNNFPSREYDYDKLEAGLLGYEEVSTGDVTK